MKKESISDAAEEYYPSTTPSDSTKVKYHFMEVIYPAKTWSKPRKIFIQSVRPAGELFLTHSFFVTNLVEAFTPKAFVRTYQI